MRARIGLRRRIDELGLTTFVDRAGPALALALLDAEAPRDLTQPRRERGIAAESRGKELAISYEEALVRVPEALRLRRAARQRLVHVIAGL
ncbi:MAG: hypothetical protein IPQ07_26490 [Myxococcales bacterium]|nr:hypothetical protein [Myxococcales bacterium]